MINRFYYSLEEAASILHLDTETIYQNAIVGNITLSILYDSLPSLVDGFNGDAVSFFDPEGTLRTHLLNEGRKDIEFGCYYLDKDSVKTIRNEGVFKGIADIENDTVDLLRGQIILNESKYNGYYAILINFGLDKKISTDDLVITNEEIERLKPLKAQQDGKPTLEQVQAENEDLKEQLDKLNNSTSQTIQQQREQALLFWVEGLGRDTVKAMSKPQIHEALKKIDRIFHFSDFDKFWQKQHVIKLEAGAPTR